MLFQNHICSFSVVHVWSSGHLAFFLHYIHPHCHMLHILILQKNPSEIAPIHWSNRAADVIGCWVICLFATTRNWTSGVGGKGPSQWILSLPVPSPRPHCFHMEPRWRREAEPLSCSQPAASLVKSEDGALTVDHSPARTAGFNRSKVWVPNESQSLVNSAMLTWSR